MFVSSQPPPADAMLHALELLYALGGIIHTHTHTHTLSLSLSLSCVCLAVDDDCQLTQPLGYNMAEFPLAPMFARMLLTSGIYILVFLFHTQSL